VWGVIYGLVFGMSLPPLHLYEKLLCYTSVILIDRFRYTIGDRAEHTLKAGVPQFLQIGWVVRKLVSYNMCDLGSWQAVRGHGDSSVL
jgi:hypothetical protein